MAAAVKERSHFTEWEPEASSPLVRRPVRLGAHLHDEGADFAIIAPHASNVVLCLFDDTPDELVERRGIVRSPIAAQSSGEQHPAGLSRPAFFRPAPATGMGHSSTVK